MNKLLVIALSIMLSTSVFAGDLDSSGAPSSGSNMPTLTDIYNHLDTGTTSTPAGTFQEPSAGPTAGIGKSLTEIKAKLPAPDNTNGAVLSDVRSGKTFWGLRTDGTWGLKSGSLTSGSDVGGGEGLLTLPIPDGYYSGKTATAVDADLVTGNIKSGVNIFGVMGSAIESTGDAATGDVLSGKTFSNAGAAGITGAMPNNGAVTITPGTTDQTIAAGYHSGTGKVTGDADLTAANIKSGTTIFGVAGSVVTRALAKRVNKTGQTQCWDSAGTLLASCAGTGQDGAFQYGIDPAIVPTEGTTGAYNTPSWSGTRFMDNSDGTVTDNLTALIWMKNADCTGILNWANALTWCNNLAPPVCGLNDASSVGQWRLPNINELHSLGPTWPAGSPFINEIASYYLSSTTYAGSTVYAWYVYFSDGGVSGSYKANGLFVRCVRGGQ